MLESIDSLMEKVRQAKAHLQALPEVRAWLYVCEIEKSVASIFSAHVSAVERAKKGAGGREPLVDDGMISEVLKMETKRALDDAAAQVPNHPPAKDLLASKIAQQFRWHQPGAKVSFSSRSPTTTCADCHDEVVERDGTMKVLAARIGRGWRCAPCFSKKYDLQGEDLK